MRISDWSSDVCSSDLGINGVLVGEVEVVERGEAHLGNLIVTQHEAVDAGARHAQHVIANHGLAACANLAGKAIPLAEQTCLAVGAAVPESGEVEFDQGTISDEIGRAHV